MRSDPTVRGIEDQVSAQCPFSINKRSPRVRWVACPDITRWGICRCIVRRSINVTVLASEVVSRAFGLAVHNSNPGESGVEKASGAINTTG